MQEAVDQAWHPFDITAIATRMTDRSILVAHTAQHCYFHCLLFFSLFAFMFPDCINCRPFSAIIQLSRVDKMPLAGGSLVGLLLEGLVGVDPLALNTFTISAKQPEIDEWCIM